MRRLFLLIVPFAAILASCAGDGDYKFKDSSLPVEKRVDDLLKRMSVEEKVNQVSAQLLFMDQWAEN
ncbi:MAG: hypothetical protein IK076_00590, partial [Bacteroidales bacterium]|nr:hypothetical protein [Bacteroidales bacterium]